MKIANITTCKGRKEQIEQTLPQFLGVMPDFVNYYLVDYGCPEETGKWVENNFRENGRVNVVYAPEPTEYFHKTRALNIGFRKAIEDGADWLLSTDADILVQSRMTPLFEKLDDNVFYFAKPTINTIWTVGLILFHKNLFEKSGGYLEEIKEYGAEDTEFRLRLFYEHDHPYEFFPPLSTKEIIHGDSLRTKHYEVKDKELTNIRNSSYIQPLIDHLGINATDYNSIQKHPDLKYLFGILDPKFNSLANAIRNSVKD